MTPFIVFAHCVEAITQGSLIERVNTTDKEYHFQNWFRTRLVETHLHFDIGGRNSYTSSGRVPDEFRTSSGRVPDEFRGHHT